MGRVDYAVVRVQADTTLTTPFRQKITTAALGNVAPKAALFFLVGTDTDESQNATGTAHGIWSFGMTDGTNEAVSFSMTEDGVLAADTVRRMQDNRVIAWHDPVVKNVESSAFFVQWVTGEGGGGDESGVEIEWSDSPTTASGAAPTDDFYIVAVFFTGTDVVADLHFVDISSNGTGTVTSLGEEADLLIGFGGILDNTTNQNDHASVNISACDLTQQPSVQGHCFYCGDEDGPTTTDAYGTYWREFFQGVDVAAGAASTQVEITGTDTNGYDYSVTGANTGSGGHEDLAVLALSLGPLVKFEVSAVTLNAATGTQDINLVNAFEPGLLIWAMNQIVNVDSIDGGANAATGGVCITDGSVLYSLSRQAQENLDASSGGTVTQSFHRSGLLTGGTIPRHTQIEGTSFEFDGFDSTGWQIDITAEFGSGKRWGPYIAIERMKNGGPVDGSIPLPTADLAGTVGTSGVTGELDGALPVPTADLAGEARTIGALDGSIPVPQADLAGTKGSVGTVGGSIPVPTAALVGDNHPRGPVDADLPLPTASLAATVGHLGTLAGDLPLPTSALSGTVGADLTGTLDATLPVPTAVLTGVKGVVGSVAGTIPVPDAALAGDNHPRGPLAGEAPVPTAAIAGTVGHLGTVGGSIPLPTVDLSGTVGTDLTGTLDGTLPLPTADLAGAVTRSAVLAGTIPTPSASISGRKGSLGALDGSLPVPVVALVGQLPLGGTLQGVLPLPLADLAGTKGVLGLVSGDIPVPTVSLAARGGRVGTLAGTLPVPTASLFQTGPLALLLANAAKAVRVRLQGLSLGVPIAWPNAPFSLPSSGAWVALHIPSMGLQIATVAAGGSTTLRLEGVARFTVYGKLGSFDAEHRDIANQIATGFEGHLGLGGVRFRGASVSAPRRERGRWALDVLVEFRDTTGLVSNASGSGAASGVGFDDLANAIRTRFEDEVATPLGLRTVYDDVLMPPSGALAPWARVTVRDGTSARLDSTVRAAPVSIAIQVFVPLLQGDGEAWDLVSQIVEPFTSVEDSGITYLDSQVSVAGAGSAYWQTNVVCSARYERASP